MALLYLVRHRDLQQPLALKVLRTTREIDPMAADYFASEARALAALRHPGVPMIIDHGSCGGHPYLVMEWVEGETLAARLKQLGRLELLAVLQICHQVGNVLVAAHQLGIVHRDLKPSNLMLWLRPGLPEQVKVLDFGVARVPASTGAQRPMTVPGTILGTPEYWAPEQARGDTANIGAATDQYALAMLAYVMLSGQPAFPLRDSSQEAMQAHLVAKQLDPPPPLGPQVGSSVAACITKALSKQPADRYQSVEAFLAALAIAQKLDAEAPTKSGNTAVLASLKEPPPPQPAARRSQPLPRWLSGGLLFASGMLLGNWLGPQLSSQQQQQMAAPSPLPAVSFPAADLTPLAPVVVVAERAVVPEPKEAPPPLLDLATEQWEDHGQDSGPSALPPLARSSALPKAADARNSPVEPAKEQPKLAAPPPASPRRLPVTIEGRPALSQAQTQVFLRAVAESKICRPGRVLTLIRDRSWLTVQKWQDGLLKNEVDKLLETTEQGWQELPGPTVPPPDLVTIRCL
jgi:serine/threonine-protein kinase